jgi:hypothetical protein
MKRESGEVGNDTEGKVDGGGGHTRPAAVLATGTLGGGINVRCLACSSTLCTQL